MVKRGEKYNTVAFGTAGEHYIASLFQMQRSPFHEFRPDLKGGPENGYDPIRLEVKSGIQKKQSNRWVINFAQLSYPFCDEQSYTEFYGNTPRTRRDLGKISWRDEDGPLYYTFLRRIDGLGGKDLRGDFSTVMCQWGDAVVIPSNLIFPFFASSLATQKGTKVSTEVRNLKEKIRSNMVQNITGYDDGSRQKEDWQGITHSSAMAMYNRSSTSLTHPVQKRTFDNFEDQTRILGIEYDGLLTKKVSGPNNSKVHILYNSSDEANINRIQRRVQSRRPILEELAQEREEALQELGPRKLTSRIKNAYHNGGLDSTRRAQLVKRGISADLLNKLERLVMWQTEEDVERELALVPF